MPYAHYYNPQFVYSKPTSWRSKRFFQGVFYTKSCLYVWLLSIQEWFLIQSGLWWRTMGTWTRNGTNNFLLHHAILCLYYPSGWQKYITYYLDLHCRKSIFQSFILMRLTPERRVKQKVENKHSQQVWRPIRKLKVSKSQSKLWPCRFFQKTNEAHSRYYPEYVWFVFWKNRRCLNLLSGFSDL